MITLSRVLCCLSAATVHVNLLQSMIPEAQMLSLCSRTRRQGNPSAWLLLLMLVSLWLSLLCGLKSLPCWPLPLGHGVPALLMPDHGAAQQGRESR